MKKSVKSNQDLLNIALSISLFWLIQISIIPILLLFPDSFAQWGHGMLPTGGRFKMGVDPYKLISLILLMQTISLILPPIIAKLFFKDNKYVKQSFLICFIQFLLLLIIGSIAYYS